MNKQILLIKMKISDSNLKKLEDFKGFLNNNRVTDLFNLFDIKFAAGHWCASSPWPSAASPRRSTRSP